MTGSSAHLLKVGSKRRRTKAEMEEHKEMQENIEQRQREKDQLIEELQQELNASKRKASKAAFDEQAI